MTATRKQPATTQDDLDFYTNRCDGLPRDGVLRSLDRQIDALVYDLYALTPAEIKIVEGTT
jgi:hypothetical protein